MDQCLPYSVASSFWFSSVISLTVPTNNPSNQTHNHGTNEQSFQPDTQSRYQRTIHPTRHTITDKITLGIPAKIGYSKRRRLPKQNKQQQKTDKAEELKPWNGRQKSACTMPTRNQPSWQSQTWQGEDMIALFRRFFGLALRTAPTVVKAEDQNDNLLRSRCFLLSPLKQIGRLFLVISLYNLTVSRRSARQVYKSFWNSSMSRFVLFASWLACLFVLTACFPLILFLSEMLQRSRWN